MNDLHYIFYEAKRMYLDTSEMSCAAERAHRRLCDFIWFMDAPAPNRSKSLQQITHTDAADWGEVKRELIGKGWLELNEYFLHRGVIKTLNESKVKYVENFNRQAPMNRLPKLVLSSPDAVTGIVTYYVTPSVTMDVTLPVTPTVTTMQSESQPESESEKKTPPSKQAVEEGAGETIATGAEEVPTLDQAMAMTQAVGISADFVKMVYERWVHQNGRNGNGILMPWLKHVTHRWTNEKAQWLAGTHTGNRNDKNRSKPNQRNVGMSETAADKSRETVERLQRRATVQT